jgi:hypothetical protein
MIPLAKYQPPITAKATGTDMAKQIAMISTRIAFCSNLRMAHLAWKSHLFERRKENDYYNIRPHACRLFGGLHETRQE